MTVSYNEKFLKLLFRWKGSLWKAIWKDLLVFVGAFYALNFTYRFALNDHQKDTFELITVFCNRAQTYIPVTFLLGFFVSQVITRWWEQFESITWPDSFMMQVAAFLPGEENRLIRKTLARWLNLTALLGWKIISPKVLKRFPTTTILVQGGMMTQEEGDLFDGTSAPYGKFWLPNIWIVNLLKKCYNEGRMNSLEMEQLLTSMNSHRAGCKKLTLYDWISVPLVYTQVSTIATYGYFLILLMGRQLLDNTRPIPKEQNFAMDIYVPIVTILEFLFYMGWLKVAEELINPFGEDDQDYELNYILDRNLSVSYRIAETGPTSPEVTGDPHRGINSAEILPYTKASLKSGYDTGYQGHLGNIKLSKEDMELVSAEEMERLKPGRGNKNHTTQKVHPVPVGARNAAVIYPSPALSSRVGGVGAQMYIVTNELAGKGEDDTAGIVETKSPRREHYLPSDSIDSNSSTPPDSSSSAYRF